VRGSRPTIARALTLAALVAAALSTAGRAVAQSAVVAQVANPVSLPDIAIGSAKARVTITEYASMSCPHCAAFGENVFPMLRTRYIDTGKVRFLFREFPLDITAAAASMLAALKVTSTPTFFVNGQKLQGAMSFEELEAIIKPMLKR
jgi:protein-disulfide isomerase